jgi:hypothetical protein
MRSGLYFLLSKTGNKKEAETKAAIDAHGRSLTLRFRHIM